MSALSAHTSPHHQTARCTKHCECLCSNSVIFIINLLLTYIMYCCSAAVWHHIGAQSACSINVHFKCTIQLKALSCTNETLLFYRLKAAQGSKTMTSLLALNCQRRILLTGTPVQNNLDEFFGRHLEHVICCRNHAM